MRKILFLISCLVQVLLLSPLAVLGNEASAQIPSTQSAKGVLWEIKSAANTAYLFGSIHFAKVDFYPLPAAVEAAYRKADVLAVEADPTDSSAVEKSMPLLTYATPDKLEKHVSEKTWADLKSLAGPAVEQFQTLRPGMLVSVLSVIIFSRQGYDQKYGIDLHFINQAKADKKKLVELESLEFQASVLGGLSDADGDAIVAETLQDLRSGTYRRDAEMMVDAWKVGDAQLLAKAFRDAINKSAESKKFMKLLLDDRNIDMAKKIMRMLEAGDKAFIVVGAGHVVGADSIPDLLQKQGLQVRQIK